ncbi:MAG TPA: type II toxin-antitoxin system RelE/ParE family toxin [Nanoarchaeota archaeon]|nr:type II toxin-antitoxin system RelE/ParE family toxin [Nanoarchaeota archaeon]
MFCVELSQHAQRFLNKLDAHIKLRIEERLKRLGENPVPSDVKFICRADGDKVFRYRIGDYRALYKVKETDKIVLIAKIDKRPRVYGRLDL